MTRLTGHFAIFKSAGRKALVPCTSTDVPILQQTATILHILVKAGTGLPEQGISFSGYATDGKTIRKANEPALARGTTLRQTQGSMCQFRRENSTIPLIRVDCLNSFGCAGFAVIMQKTTAAGVDAVILVNCLTEAALVGNGAVLKTKSVILVLLATPATTVMRCCHILARAEGFLYFVSLRGVTGTRSAQTETVATNIRTLKQENGVPVYTGLGICDSKTLRDMTAFADGMAITAPGLSTCNKRRKTTKILMLLLPPLSVKFATIGNRRSKHGLV